mmetsp:Transcript_16255/g.67248  ORF Transcript_16255/g.67248 Transcript_16255/m.67248 type:complete len:114 (-) Transcript_16255:42-383(-)
MADWEKERILQVHEFLSAKERGDVDAALRLCSGMMLIITDADGDLFGEEAVAKYIERGRGRKIHLNQSFGYQEKPRSVTVVGREKHHVVFSRQQKYDFHFEDSRIRALVVSNL